MIHDEKYIMEIINMSITILNERCKKILKMLLWSNDYIPLQQIIEETKVSKRSIYYDICKINEWLDDYNISELIIERGKGVLISINSKSKIEQVLNEEAQEENYFFLPSKRVKIIICYIIYSNSAVYIEQLTECCQVSRNTIFGDLRVVVNYLHEYDLKLEYETKKGYFIIGDEIRVLALFLLYFNELKILYDDGILKFYRRCEIKEYLKKLENIEKELGISYVEGCLLSLAVLISAMNKEKGELYFPGLKKNEIVVMKEFKLVKKYFANLNEKEMIYLTLHLLGARITTATDDMFENSSNQSVYGITKALVAEFEKTACVNFENKEDLERSLFVHINSSLYRYQYGIQVGNPMCDDIIREYPHLFEITKIVCKYLEKMVGIPMPDSEVAYLALHFGAYLKISSKKDERLRILIVCANGISTGNMIKREIKKLLPNAQIIGVVAAVNVVNLQSICDLVISAVKVKSSVPVIFVHPIITDEDRKHILNHHLVINQNRICIEDSLYDVVKKYVNPDDYENLKLDIVHCLQRKEEDFNISIIEQKNGLLEKLNIAKIKITDETFLWQDSIRYVGEELIHNGSVKKQYIETIISQILYYGTYMFLTDEVMLAHAKPEDGVIRMDVAMTIFKKPVHFQDSRNAKIIFMLAAEDQEKHLKILEDIFKIVEKKKYIEELVGQKTKEDILINLQRIFLH